MPYLVTDWLFQLRVKVKDSGTPVCEIVTEVPIRVARNVFDTSIINLPQTITISQYDSGNIYTVRSTDTDLRVSHFTILAIYLTFR